MLQNKMALQQFAICAGGSIGLRLLRSQKRVKLPLTAENRCGQELGRLNRAATAHGFVSLSALYPSKAFRPTYLAAQVFSQSSERSARQGTGGRRLRAMLYRCQQFEHAGHSRDLRSLAGSQRALVVRERPAIYLDGD